MSSVALCEAPSASVRERVRVLIADDDELFCATVADLLGESGYAVDTVPCSNSALSQLRTQAYALLIADVRMPGNEALELVSAAHAEWPEMPVIVVSGFPDRRAAAATAAGRVAATLLKPFSADALLSVVDRALEQARALADARLANTRIDTGGDLSQDAAHALSVDHAYPDGSVGAFVHGTIDQIVRGLIDIRHVTEALQQQHHGETVCGLLHCQRHRAMTAAIEDAIVVLEGTKHAFKSPQLYALRRRLEAVLAEDRER